MLMKHQLSDIESEFCNLKPTDNSMILLQLQCQLQCLSLTGNHIGSLYYNLPVKHNYINAENQMATPLLKIYSHLNNHLLFGVLWCSWSVVVLHCQKTLMLQILCKWPLCVFSPFSQLFGVSDMGHTSHTASGFISTGWLSVWWTITGMTQEPPNTGRGSQWDALNVLGLMR